MLFEKSWVLISLWDCYDFKLGFYEESILDFSVGFCMLVKSIFCYTAGSLENVWICWLSSYTESLWLCFWFVKIVDGALTSPSNILTLFGCLSVTRLAFKLIKEASGWIIS